VQLVCYAPWMGNREDLLRGAKACLLEKGYTRTTVRDIAAAAGVSMAAIGYHYGSREALLNEAMFEAMGEWGESMGRRVAEKVDPAASPGERYAAMWTAIVDVFDEYRPLWLTTFEAFLVSEHNPELRRQLAGGQWEGIRGMAADLAGVPEDEVDEATVRTIGAVHTALLSGLMSQYLLDPGRAPDAGEVMAGLRALGRLAGPDPG
jgi:AcrR family transcriptional regulator